MFFDKKFGLPQGLIDAANKVHKENVKEHFVANPKMAHHYEKGELAATVMADNDEHGNHCGHKVHFFKNGKKQESKTYYAETELDAHDVAKQYISQGLNSVHKEEVTFSEAELAHINELLVPNTDKVTGSLFNYLKKRSDSRTQSPFSSLKPDAPAAKSGQLALSGPKKTLALSKPEAKPATHSAEPMVKTHYDMHTPEQKGTKSTTLTLPSKGASASNRSGTTADAIAARQKVNSSVGVRKTAVDAPIPYIDGHPKNSVRGSALPTKVSADPKSTQTASVDIQKTTLPVDKSAVLSKAAKSVKSTADKKQAGTGKVDGAGRKTADLTKSVKPTTATKTPRNVHPKFEEGGGVSHYTIALGTAYSSKNSTDYGSSLRSLSANKKMKVGDVRNVVAELTKHAEASKMTRAKAVEHLAQHYESKHGKLAEEYLIFFEQELLDTFSDKELEFITGYYQGNE